MGSKNSGPVPPFQGEAKKSTGGLPDPSNASKDPLGYAEDFFTSNVMDPLQVGGELTGRGGSSKKNSPAPPDFQGAVDKQTKANRPDINTPFSSQKWTQDADGKWHLETGLSDQVKSTYAKAPPVDYGALPAAETGQQGADAVYRSAQSRLDPQFANRENELRQQLANQGLDPNSAAAQNAMRSLASERNDAYGAARDQSFSEGRLEANDSVARRQAALSEAMGRHELPIKDLASQRGFLDVPGFSQGGDNLRAMSDLFGAQMSQWNATNQQKSDLFGSLAKFLANIF